MRQNSVQTIDLLEIATFWDLAFGILPKAGQESGPGAELQNLIHVLFFKAPHRAVAVLEFNSRPTLFLCAL